MINIPGGINNDLCDDGGIKLTRRDLLKVGGSGMLGLSLGSMLQMQAKANESGHGGGPGWGHGGWHGTHGRRRGDGAWFGGRRPSRGRDPTAGP